MKTCITGSLIVAMLNLAFATRIHAEEATPANPPAKPLDKVEIGLPASLFQGVPKFLVNELATPFKQYMKAQTGIAGDVHNLPDAMTVARMLNDGGLDLAVFQGHEFAWAKNKYPELFPLAVILPDQPPTMAYLIVRWDCKATDLAGLNGQKFTMPPGSKDHTMLFLNQQRKVQTEKCVFSAELRADSVEDAIFDVIDKKVQATCIDSVALEYFRSKHPGQFKNLRILQESEIFPQACIAGKKGRMDEVTIKKFRDALLRAGTLPEGKKMMDLWRLKKFEGVPVTYEKHLENCNKSYPAPGSSSK